jgi:hypothetical protein
MSAKSITELNLNSVTISNSNNSNVSGYKPQENTLTTDNTGQLLVNNLPISSGGSSNIRSGIYNNPSGQYITLSANTVYTHEFLFPFFNVTPQTVVNVTFSEYTTVSPGTIIDPAGLPLWSVIDITPSNSGTTASIVIKYIGAVMSGGTSNLGLQSLNIMIMNN